jgi:hypothetical protein
VIVVPIFDKVVSVEEAVEILRDRLKSNKFRVGVKENIGVVYVDTIGLDDVGETLPNNAEGEDLMNLF